MGLIFFLPTASCQVCSGAHFPRSSMGFLNAKVGPPGPPGTVWRLHRVSYSKRA